MMLLYPPAKINIGLYITGRRKDGFHDIETLMYPVGLTDLLEVRLQLQGESDYCDLTVAGIPLEETNSNNLVVSAYDSFTSEHKLPGMKAWLYKQIPVGAGLGGGSADGAFMARAVNELAGLGLTPAALRKQVGLLGSDCPFFIDLVPALARGRGEILDPVAIDLSSYWIILVHPGRVIQTGEAYRQITPGTGLSDWNLVHTQPVREWKHFLVNHFEDYAFREIPLLEEIKTGLYKAGALYASLSGSGSALYGIFKEPADLSGSLQKYVIWAGWG
ncbi:MAG: 4-(cytidine 5'-diphospho)-2-C-methyl-D-erythritol kinase [Bacteroidales bacterium]|nr:4-(cytidine 5'-diphospho)-2-C-methyl-D-erythritol kinase [Bacteroidales bacterium]